MSGVEVTNDERSCAVSRREIQMPDSLKGMSAEGTSTLPGARQKLGADGHFL